MKLGVPNSATVDSAFRSVEKRLNTVRKKINSTAAKAMKSGNYGVAQKLMENGRAVAEFTDRVEAFVQEWKRLVKTTRLTDKSAEPTTLKVTLRKPSRTPLWKFCIPALDFVVSRGGSATHDEVITGLEESMGSFLTPKDREPKSPRNPPRWYGTVKKAYKHCQREGWIDKRTDGVWKITAKGREALDGSREQRA